MSLIILTVSTICQFVSAYLAFRLNKITEHSIAWVIFAVSIASMGLRRTYSLLGKSFIDKPIDIGAESIALFISLTMLIALIKIKPFLKRIQENSSLKKEKDLALQESKAKSEFLAIMSHEIRTPLNGIVGSLNLLSDSKGLDQEQKQFLSIINSSSDALIRIINDILDFSKIEAGKMTLEKIIFSLDDMLSSIRTLFIPIADSKGLEFIAPNTGIKFNLIGDAGRIQQIIINLINNAMKFTSEGHVLVNTKVVKSGRVNKLLIEIEDSGIGISKENLDLIFNSFQQEDSSITRKFGGTGLGLSISQKLAGLMGGGVTVRSEEGKGTTFSVELLVETTEQEIKSIDTSLINKFKGKVLLVEDNKANQILATKMLHKLDLEIDTAVNGKEAVEMSQVFKYDLILMDMMMPVMDGITATEEIKRVCKSPPPIVAMTANAFEEDKQKCFKAGMSGFISKPIRPQALNLELAKYLEAS